jgi:signal transduction histidine kinase
MQVPTPHPELKRLVESTKADLPLGEPAFQRFLEQVEAIVSQAESGRQAAERALEYSTQELIQAHEEVRAVLRSQPDIILYLDTDGSIRSCSTSSYRDLALPPQMLIGRKIDRLPQRAIGRQFRKALEEARQTGRLQSFEYELAPRGKKVSSFEARVVPMGLDHWVVVIRNVDEQKNLESQLVHAQKLESIALLAAGIAHEVNTPTQYITDNVRFLDDSFRELSPLLSVLAPAEASLASADSGGDRSASEQAQGQDATDEDARNRSADDAGANASGRSSDDTREDARWTAVVEAVHGVDLVYLLEEIPAAIGQSLEGLAHVARIVSAMKEFSHPGTNEKTPTDLNRALENTTTVSRNEWKYVADVEYDFDPELPAVRCLPAELNQVFLNLLVNAAHAIAEAVRTGQRERGTIRVRTRKEGDCVEVCIADSGTGIPEHAQARVFDPFFTTKAAGKGTGQGLAIARTVVVEKHGGTIRFETVSGQGTTFYVRIPIEPAGARSTDDTALDSAA